LGHTANDFSVSMSVAGQVFSLPMYPYLGKNDQDKIIEIIKNA